jgi:hypothetical protein
MALRLPPKRGLSAPIVNSIPETWDKIWFSKFITNYLENADVRNAVSGSGITISATPGGAPTITSQATISSSGSGAGQTSSVVLTGGGSDDGGSEDHFLIPGPQGPPGPPGPPGPMMFLEPELGEDQIYIFLPH